MSAILLVSAGVGGAYAQGAASGPGEGEPGTAAEAPAARPTLAQRLAGAREVSTRATQLVRGISGMLDEAREEGDIIRVTCLNDKLAQGNATSTTVDERLGFLEEAVTQGDEGRGEHESTMIEVLDQKLDTLEVEASECVGQNLFETGDTVVSVDIDPATPTEDPTVLPTVPDFPYPYIPPPASGVI